MTNGAKRTGGEPDFDTQRAWARFERLAAREPVPAYWRQADEHIVAADARKNLTLETNRKEDGDFQMKDTTEAEHVGSADGSAGGAIGESNAGTRISTPIGSNSRSSSGWHTESRLSRRLRRLTAAAAAAVIAVGLFATPLGDRALGAMLQTFRIQHVVGVGISADDMASVSELLEKGSPDGDRSFSLAQYGTLAHSGGGKAVTITWDEAEQRMGASLLRLGNSTAPVHQPSSSMTFQLNVNAVNRLLIRLGSGTTLPAEADGKAIRLHIPDGITTEGTLAGKPARLLQFGKPELTVDSGIDAAAVREAVLGLPVLPESIRSKLAAIGDWQSTLPIPARDGVTTSIRLAGYDAVMTSDSRKRYLLWVEGSRIGLLTVDLKDYGTELSFRQAAEELIRR